MKIGEGSAWDGSAVSLTRMVVFPFLGELAERAGAGCAWNRWMVTGTAVRLPIKSCGGCDACRYNGVPPTTRSTKKRRRGWVKSFQPLHYGAAWTEKSSTFTGQNRTLKGCLFARWKLKKEGAWLGLGVAFKKKIHSGGG